jgi:hypothetical protein
MGESHLRRRAVCCWLLAAGNLARQAAAAIIQALALVHSECLTQIGI